ncbi:MAG: GTP cyclohydrolase IIa [Candidatus Bathyarchaeia archaeon]
MKQPHIQVTLIQIDNYGPWTTTLGNDREHRLQILQAELYSSLQKSFSPKNALVFYNRFDEMLAVTNGISREEHKEIQANVQDHFPFTVSMSIGVDISPFKAHVRASRMLQTAGSAQSSQRKNVLMADETLRASDGYVQIAHIDVDDITDITDHSSPFETSIRLLRSHLELMTVFSQLDSLLFYMGGDNFMAVTRELSEETIAEKLSNYSLNGLPLKFGLGIAQTARKAAELATMNLEHVRLSRDKDNYTLSPHLRDSR